MANSSIVSDLKWIEDEKSTQIERPEFDKFEAVNQRTFKTLVLDRCQENILVPLGLAATTVCLTMGLINMKSGNAAKQQLYMRGRVGFQSATLAAMAFTMYQARKKRNN